MRWFVAFLLSLSFVSALNGFSASKDYARNGFAVPGFVSIIIPDVNEVITSVPGPAIITQPNPSGRQVFVESTPLYSSSLVARPVVAFSEGPNAPFAYINMFDRALDSGFYIGQYGLEKQYIKSIDPSRFK